MTWSRTLDPVSTVRKRTSGEKKRMREKKKRGEGIGFEQVPGRNRKTGEKQEHGRKDSVLRKVSGGKPGDSGTWRDKGTRSKGYRF